MENESLVLRVGKNTLLIAVAVFVGYVISFFYKIVLARLLGPADFGAFALLSVVIGVMASFLTLGVPTALTKYVAEYSAEKKSLSKILSTARSLLVSFGIVAAILIILIAEPLASLLKIEGHVFELRLAGVAAVAGIFNSYLTSILAGMQRFDMTFWTGIIDKASKLVITFALLAIGLGLKGAVIGIIAGFVISSLYVYLISRKLIKMDLSLWSIDKSSASMLVKFGMPIFLGSIASLLLGWTDTFMLGIFTTSTQVGYYNAAVPIMWYLAFPVGSLAAAMFPAFSELAAKNRQATIHAAFNKIVKFSFVFLLPASAGISILAEPLVAIFFGASYIPSVPALKVLAFAAVFSGLASFFSSFYSGIGKPKVFMKYTMMAAVFNFAANVILIPIYGIVGAAAASLTSLALMISLSFWNSRKIVKIEMGYLPKIILSTSAMSAIVYYLNIKLPLLTIERTALLIIIGVISYFAVLKLIGGFTKEEQETALSVVRQKFSKKH